MPVTSGSISEIISANAAGSGPVFVFPSEVIAAFRRDEYLRGAQERRAVRADRFISWDTFKERVFRAHQTRRPANRLYRTVFAADFLARNRKTPFLERLVNPEFAENGSSFERYIRSVLPGLHTLFGQGESTLSGIVDGSLARDLSLLYNEYRGFLDRYHLFEPGWTDAQQPVVDRSYLIFFSEVLEDFPQYAAVFRSIPRITVVGDAEAVPSISLLEYESSVRESDELLDQIEALLDGGVHPSRIVVTLASPGEYRPFLEREATLRRIPLIFRGGKPLSDYAPGQFLSQPGRVTAGGFGVDSLKSLCLNQGVPWRSPESNRALVRFGMEWNVARTWRERGGAEQDGWLDAFARAGADMSESSRASGADTDQAAPATRAGELRRYYRALKVALVRISDAKSFRSLREAVYAFLEQFLDTGAWDGESLPAFQSCMEVLADLVAAEADLRSLPVDLDPYAVWTSAMSENLYVPRSAEEGVSVYPYRVSAGLCPEYHFVAGASHGATQVVFARYPYLRDDQKRKLAIEDRDLSSPFMELYVRSGRKVSVTYARETTAGTQLASGYFVRTQSVARAEEGGRLTDPYHAETAFWSFADAGLFPKRLYPAQQEGISFQAFTGLAARGADFVREVITDGTLRGAMTDSQLSRRRAGYLALSAAHLERFRQCPFAYGLAYALDVDEQPFELDYYGAAAFGNMYHRVLEELYTAIGEQTGEFLVGEADRYRSLLDSLIDRVTDRRFEPARLSPDGEVPVPAGRPLFRPLAEVFRSAAHRLLPLLLDADTSFAPGHRLESAEGWYDTFLDENQVELFGRIDRITRDPDRSGYTLVDYKKNRTPRPADFARLLAGAEPAADSDGDAGGEEAGERSPADSRLEAGVLQIPIYAVLAAAKGRDLDRAAYYSIEQGRYVPVFDRTGGESILDEEAMQEIVRLVLNIVGSTAARIRAGDYRAVGTDGSESGCNGCPMRSVCRARYVVRTP